MNQFERSLESVDRGQRLGLVLSAITKFMQICNHPDLYEGRMTATRRPAGNSSSSSSSARPYGTTERGC